MRRLLSPPAMLRAADGAIDQEFFRPKKVVTLEERRWGDAERDALHRGLEKHGVGKWREIGDELLPVRRVCFVWFGLCCLAVRAAKF